jgi:hypothetical protein
MRQCLISLATSTPNPRALYLQRSNLCKVAVQKKYAPRQNHTCVARGVVLPSVAAIADISGFMK